MQPDLFQMQLFFQPCNMCSELYKLCARLTRHVALQRSLVLQAEHLVRLRQLELGPLQHGQLVRPALPGQRQPGAAVRQVQQGDPARLGQPGLQHRAKGQQPLAEINLQGKNYKLKKIRSHAATYLARKISILQKFRYQRRQRF